MYRIIEIDFSRFIELYVHYQSVAGKPAEMKRIFRLFRLT